jgi:glutaminase
LPQQPQKPALQAVVRIVRCEMIMEGLYEVAGQFMTA